MPKTDNALPPTSRAVRWGALVIAVLALILVPFFVFGAAIEGWSESAFQSIGARPFLSGTLIAVLLMTDVLLPVPSSIVSTLSGVFHGVVAGAAISWLGMTLGAGLGYFIGRTAGQGFANRLVGPREVERLEGLTRRYGAGSLAIYRAVPVLAEASVVMAGMGSMRIGPFLLVTGAANLGIALVYAAVGAFAADVQSFLLAFAGATLIPVGGAAALRLMTARGGVDAAPLSEARIP